VLGYQPGGQRHEGYEAQEQQVEQHQELVGPLDHPE
jgi:hypothetical protein